MPRVQLLKAEALGSIVLPGCIHFTSITFSYVQEYPRGLSATCTAFATADVRGAPNSPICDAKDLLIAMQWMCAACAPSQGAGIVESVGEGVTSVKPGDHVIPMYTPQCDKCVHCRATGAKTTNLCSAIRATQGKGVMPDGTSRFKSVRTGSPIFHFMGCSTFSEYTVLPEIALAVIPKEAPLDKVCLLGCGVTTGYGTWRGRNGNARRWL